MIPDWIGANLFNAFAIGAKQFVVQDAADIIVSSLVNIFSLTPNTTVGRSLPAGADITTFFAPASIWACAFAFDV